MFVEAWSFLVQAGRFCRRLRGAVLVRDTTPYVGLVPQFSHKLSTPHPDNVEVTAGNNAGKFLFEAGRATTGHRKVDGQVS